MLADTQTIVYASSWYQTGLLSILGAAFGSTLLWLGLRLVGKVDRVKEDIEEMRKDIVLHYRRKEDCRKLESPVTNPDMTKDLTTGIAKLNTDLAALTTDIDNLRNIAGSNPQIAVML